MTDLKVYIYVRSRDKSKTGASPKPCAKRTGLALPRLSEKSRLELKSLYPTTGATTNFQSSQGGPFTFKTVSPTTKDLFNFVAIGGNIHSHLSNIRSGSLFLTPR